MKKILLITLVGLGSSVFTLCKGQTFYSYGFDSLSSGMTSRGAYVLALAMKDSTQNSHLYAGGHFTIAGRDTAINVAEWMDTGYYYNSLPQGKWVSLGTGVNSDICALAMYDSCLYAGGKFDTAGGIAASHIARWDTAKLQWDSLRGTLNGNVYALCVYNDSLYVGGDFTIAGGDTVNRIAIWNGSAWSAVGKGFDTGAVYALTVSNDTLYAGGSFIKSNGMVVNHVAQWKGTHWDSLGSGTNNTVYALSGGGIYNISSLFVGGAFTQAGGIPSNYIAMYGGYYSPSWSSLYSGINDTVRALNAGNAVIESAPIKQGFGGGDILLIGGNFDSAGGYSSHYIVGWYGGGWDTVGELNGPVFALANPNFGSNYVGGGNNYVGGRFSIPNNRNVADTSNNVAYLYVSIGGGISTITDKSWVDVYPNPSDGVFTILINVVLFFAK